MHRLAEDVEDTMNMIDFLTTNTIDMRRIFWQCIKKQLNYATKA